MTSAVFMLGLFLGINPLGVFHRKDKQEAREPEFVYAGGTEDVSEGCTGVLQLLSSSMTYKCAQHTLIVPYNAIDVMEYRRNVSDHIWKMNPDWKVKPPEYHLKGKQNHYFTLVYRDAGATHILVLDVPVDEMNPYLAEIELKADRRVDVQRHEDYQ
jgi:hypothetical protein